MENLGVDIPFIVLSQLPSKDLVYLKGVSKTWKSLISDLDFIHVQSKNKQPLSGFFFQQKYQWCEDDIKTISYISADTLAAELKQDIFNFLPQDVVVLASSNGIVCCRSCFPFKDPSIYVCNPLNKDWVEIEWDEPEKHNNIALAFDPSLHLTSHSTTFKLVRVHHCETDLEEWYFTFQIYSSSSKEWRYSEEICWCSNIIYKNSGVFVGGILHWLTDGDQILSFDVENECALLISSPIPMGVFVGLPEACIGESGGKLHYVLISEGGLHVWFLEDSFEFNWVLRHFKTLEELECSHPHFFSNLYVRMTERRTLESNPWIDPLAYEDGMLLMRISNSIYLYDIESGKLKEVCGVSKFGPNSIFFPIVLPYSMSLVPLHGE